MKIEAFKLERFFAEYEFKVRYQLSASDCESMRVKDLLDLSEGDAWEELSELRLGYSESKGSPRLREAIAGTYSKIRGDGVLVAAPEEALFLFLQGHLQKGDHVIVTTPAYQSLLSLPASIGCRLTEWPVELKNGEWRLDIDFLEDRLEDSTAMVIVNIPHNPTGLSLTAGEKNRIVELLERRETLLFADEMYYRLEYGEEVSGTSFADLYAHTVCLSGLSKSYGLPGLRIGWLASQQEELLEAAAALKDYTTICNSAPSELLGLTAVENAGRIIQRNLDIVKTNLQELRRLVQRRPGTIDLNRGGGGSVIFPRLTGGKSAKDFSRKLIEKRNLLILSGDIFDMPEDFFRLGLGRADFPEALRVFEEEL
jgi:aspartate/methionine/tyrosine aminotransferase